MFVKAIVFTALVTSTPIAILATQDPQQSPQPSPTEVRRQNVDLAQLRQELDAARADLQQVRAQLEQALDALDRCVEPRRDNNSCSQSRSRALMSHYQWLRDQGHASRAAGALTKIADQVGDDVQRLNGTAWELMTDKNTAGKFDELALALADRMAAHQDQLHPNHFDTMALAQFLNGHVDRAIELEQQALERAGNNNDDFRRKLRTYEAARTAIASHQDVPVAQEKLVAVGGGD